MFPPPTTLTGWMRLLLGAIQVDKHTDATITRLYRENDQLKRQVAHLEMNIQQVRTSHDAMLEQITNGEEALRELRKYLPQLRTTDADLSDIFRQITELVRHLQRMLREEG